jgi:two-component system, response regulator / RNA-binding antiterminator
MLKALRDIAKAQVLVFHPKDRECGELVAQLHRIGCHVEAVWPPQDAIPPETTVAFMLFREDLLTKTLLRGVAERGPSLTVIAIIEFESPSVIEAVAQAGINAVVTKPIRAFGLLTSMVLARNVTEREKKFSGRILKLESRITNLKNLEVAKSILMAKKSISEKEAYELLRARAMSSRMTLESVCESIIRANQFLDF